MRMTKPGPSLAVVAAFIVGLLAILGIMWIIVVALR
jgi:hypothetical protein